MNYIENLKNYTNSVAAAVTASPLEKLDQVAENLMKTCKQKGWIYTAGNGGSASTASHFANDLVKGLNMAYPRFKARALNDNIPINTALANDLDYSSIFCEQLKNYIEPGDIFIPFSGSGNSPNVVNAAHMCQEWGHKVISFTGKGGGKLKKYSDICCEAPTAVMEEIEDIHLIWEHALITVLRKNIQKK